MTSICKVVGQIHAIATKVFELISLSSHLPLHGLAWVAYAFLDIASLLINLGAIEQRLSKIAFDNVKVYTSHYFSLFSATFLCLHVFQNHFVKFSQFKLIDELFEILFRCTSFHHCFVDSLGLLKIRDALFIVLSIRKHNADPIVCVEYLSRKSELHTFGHSQPDSKGLLIMTLALWDLFSIIVVGA